jgi:hypothetical protein
MKYIDVSDEYVKSVFAANDLVSKIDESAEVASTEVEQEIVESAEAEHACPLCESELEAPVSEESMAECVQFILEALNEAVDAEGETLEESEDEDELEEE